MINTAKINLKLELIKTHIVENHMGEIPENVDWATVGSSSYVLNQLSEIVEFLGIKEGDNGQKL
jgi:hypothetical protein